MSKHKVLFQPHHREIAVEAGESLIRAALDAGVHVNASCGGEGLCGKCRVIIEKGIVDGGITEKLSKEEIEKGYRLACLSKIAGDLMVRIPVESAMDATVLQSMATPRKTARIKKISIDDLKENGRFHPPVEKKYFELPAPSAKDNVSDVTRMVRCLRDNFQQHRLEFEMPVIRRIPETLRESDFKATITIVRSVRPDGKNRVIHIEPGDTTARNYAIAVDIGTTTIWGEMVDLITGKTIAQHADFNSQISYGEDVITRIVYAEKQGGLDKLNEKVVGTVNSVIEKILKESHVRPDEISLVTLAGNTTMTQLFLRINPRYIRRSPYVPAASIYPPVKAPDIGLNLAEHVLALIYPQVSSYVGGDIVAGVMGSGMARDPRLTLYMDIGTNAEIVIGNKDWMACAACSAGPAFEGGGITMGMRAAEGAIEDFSIDPVALEPMNITIGNVRPRGICGSGLIAVTAALFEAGVIDNRGKFDRTLGSPRIRKSEDVWEFVLAWKNDAGIDRDVVLTEIDLDNLLRAKGAIYSGCVTLLAEVGLSIENLERIIIAGAFGSYVDLERCMTIGLLPEIDPDKVSFIGNGSLLGARMNCLTNQIRSHVGEVLNRMTNFELSETASYMENYVAALFFPHTDIHLFPKLKTRLEERRRKSTPPNKY